MLRAAIVLRCQVAAASSRASAPATATTSTNAVAAAFVQHANVVRFNEALFALRNHAVNRSIVDRLMAEHNVPTAHLDTLEAAGAVVIMDDLVHCHPPALVYEAYQLAACLDGTQPQTPLDSVLHRLSTPPPSSSSVTAALWWDPCVTERAALKAAHQELTDLHPAYQALVAKAARRRKTMWGSAVMFGGLQLAAISRLTYFDLDWDIMEPVSYFLGTGTSIAFFVFMLRYGAECTPNFFDQTHIGSSFAKEDIVIKYLNIKDRILAIEDAIARKESWVAGQSVVLTPSA
jgi:hypothetical protein